MIRVLDKLRNGDSPLVEARLSINPEQIINAPETQDLYGLNG